jgi:hypothetical protein
MNGFAVVMAALAIAQADGAPAPSVPVAPPRPAAVTAPVAGAPPRPPVPELERTQVARAALAFLDALVGGDADALVAASTERFSFDGDVRIGRDLQRRTWREALARREAPRAALLDLEILQASEAGTRLGPPPPRVAPLAAPGTWVGLADLSGRAVVLFLARDGARWAVAGMHD